MASTPFSRGQGDDALDVEVGFDGSFALADQVGFVGLEAVQGEAVFLGIDGDGAQAEFVGGAEDADGDFAAIQSQKFFHGLTIRMGFSFRVTERGGSVSGRAARRGRRTVSVQRGLVSCWMAASRARSISAMRLRESATSD